LDLQGGGGGTAVLKFNLEEKKRVLSHVTKGNYAFTFRKTGQAFWRRGNGKRVGLKYGERGEKREKFAPGHKPYGKTTREGGRIPSVLS